MPPKNPKFDLKKKFQRVFEVCIILSITIIIASFKLSPENSTSSIEFELPQEVISLEDVMLTDINNVPPPPPKPVILIESPIDDEIEDVKFEDTEINFDDNISVPPIFISEKDDEVPDEFFISVEHFPTPIGGLIGIQQKIVYPEIAKRAGVQGKVFIKAYVDETGTVQKAEIIKGIGAGCDEAALEAVMLTKFNPGLQREKPVKVQVSIPILFKLN